MKLLTRYNRISLITTILVILMAGIIYYYTVSTILVSQIDKDLVVEEDEILDFVKLNNRLPQVFNTSDQQISFIPVQDTPVVRRYVDTVYYNIKEKENQSGRGLITTVNVKGIKYRALVLESKVETNDLIKIIFAITIGVIILLLTVLFVINRLVIGRLWSPFYKILWQIKQFNLKDRDNIPQLSSQIDEFKELNEAVTAMSQRAKGDYHELKTFTENASHELLTPIAVINSKLDTLLQSGEFTERQSQLLGDVYETVSRLTRLNRTMLLLAKIENGLIQDSEELDVKQVTEELLGQFNELFTEKNITVNADLHAATITMSRSLMYVLLNNLLGNAIRHNISGGTINISLNQQQLVISNTGKLQALDTSNLFTRFSKSAESEGSGLGLTLIKQICERYGLGLIYNYQANHHSFLIGFDRQNVASQN